MIEYRKFLHVDAEIRACGASRIERSATAREVETIRGACVGCPTHAADCGKTRWIDALSIEDSVVNME
jgi:hypothetical protein